MTTKLISANMGIVLEVLRDGKQEKHEFTMRLPTHIYNQPIEAIQELCDWLNREFGDEWGISYQAHDNAGVQVPVAKPPKIKAAKRISQNEFNRRIKELQP